MIALLSLPSSMMTMHRSTTPGSYAPPAGPIRPLTEQQERVVDAIRRGLSYAEIGDALGIGRETVKGHVTAIMNVLPNPDRLPPRDCIFLWAWWRVWAVDLAMAELENAALARERAQ